MKCPFCNEEIDDQSEICDICGEKIPKNVANKKITKKQKNIMVISLIAIVVLIGLIFGSKTIYENIIVDMNNQEYKSITAHETVSPWESKLTTKETLDKLNMQNEDLLNLLKSFNFAKRKSNVFSLFLDNLKYYSQIISNRVLDDDIVYGKEGTYSGVKISRDLKILNPEAPYFKLCYYERYGVIFAKIDYNYINQTYSKYLTKDWKEYLALKSSISEHTDSRFWQDDTSNPTLKEIFDWIISYENFIKKYPDFMRNSEMKEDAKLYVDTVFRRTSPYYYKKDELKQEYENFLKTDLKDSESYKYIDEAYNILEKTGYDNESPKFSDFLTRNDFGGWGD